MHKVRYSPFPTEYATTMPVMIRALPARRLIHAYVDPAGIDPLLMPHLEEIGEATASVYDWRPSGRPAADPIVELRIHRVRAVAGGRLAVAELEPGINNLSIDRDLITADLADALERHATQMMRLMT